jgi:hypothetical protein
MLKLGYVRELTQSYGGYLSMRYAGFIGSILWSYVLSIFRLDTGGVVLAFSTLADLVFVVLAIFGVRFAYQRFAELRRERRKVPAAAVAIFVLAALLLLKAAVDIIELPLWASSWYSGPQRLLFALLLGAFAWVGLIQLRRQFLVALGTLCLMLGAVSVAVNSQILLSAGSAAPTATSWQDANLEAANWIVGQGPSGVYGSTDTGLIGFYTSPKTTIVNLDGLVNDYTYAQHLLAGDSPISLYRREHIRFLVERREAGTAAVPGCAVRLWSSSAPVTYSDAVNPSTALRVGVWDLLPCGS